MEEERSPYNENGNDRFSRQKKEDVYWEKRREKRERYAERGIDNVWARSPSHYDLQRIYEEHEEVAKRVAEEARQSKKVEFKRLKDVKKAKKRKHKDSYDSSSSSSSEDRRRKKKDRKKDKKVKKDKSERKKKSKKRRRRSSSSSGVPEIEVPAAKIKKEKDGDEWVELTKERRDEQAQKAREEEAQIIGPQIPESLLAKANTSATYFDLDANDRKNMLRGEASGMAAYIAQGKRIPRRGEIGLNSDEIAEFEKVGYIMSGTRHKSMEATRLRKENQILTAEEKRLLSGFTQEQRKQKEESVMSQFMSLVSSKRGGL